MQERLVSESSAIVGERAAPCCCLVARLAETTVPAIALDSNGRVIAANEINAALMGTTLECLVGAALRDVVGDRFSEPTMSVARRVLADGRTRVIVILWRGHWIRARYSRTRHEFAEVCVIKVDPWRLPVLEAGPTPAEPTEEFPVHDLGDLGTLSAREAEVLWMIGQGMSLPQIAKQLSRSIKTIESHVRAIGSKIKLRGRFAMGLFAKERGLTHMTRDQVERVFAERPASRSASGVASET